MKKFDKINLKRRAAKSIKEAEERGKINKAHPDGSKFQLGEDLTFDTNTNISDQISYVGSTALNTDPISFDFIPTIANWPNTQTFDSTDSYKDLEKKMENKFEQVHEELAETRKYAKNTERKLVTLTELVTKLIREKTKLKKQLRDHKEESQEWMQKYGGAMLFIKNKIIEIRRERSQIQKNLSNLSSEAA